MLILQNSWKQDTQEGADNWLWKKTLLEDTLIRKNSGFNLETQIKNLRALALEFKCLFLKKLLLTLATFFRLSQHEEQQIFIYLKIIIGSFRQCYVGQLIIHYTTGKKYINTFTKELRQYWSTIRVGYILPLVSSKHVSGSIHIASMELTQNPGWM